MGPSHFKEIDHPSITEFIDERFNGITSLMTDNALIYGGAINSVLAKIPIQGDLDIAISSAEFMKLATSISSSTMWLQIDGDRIPERNTGALSHVFSSKKISKYGEELALPLNKIATFETVNGARVQVVQAKTQTGDLMEDALSIIRAVDLRCCGVAMDKFGRLIEAVEGGYSDCLERVLRINKYDPLRDAENTRARIAKYLNRGWQLGTSIDTIMENFRKAKEEYARQQAARSHSKRKKSGKFPDGMFVVKLTDGRGAIKIFKEIIDITGLVKMNDCIMRVAHGMYSCDMLLTDRLRDRNWVMWEPKSGYSFSYTNANAVMGRVIIELETKHGINIRSQLKKPKTAPLRGYMTTNTTSTSNY